MQGLEHNEVSTGISGTNCTTLLTVNCIWVVKPQRDDAINDKTVYLRT